MTRGVKGDEYKGEGIHVRGEEIASDREIGPRNDMRVEGEDSGYPKNNS
jgi:hypothetical protein